MYLAFFVMAVIIVLTAIGVLAFKNPMNSALSLIANLLTVAAMFASLDAHFLAVVQIVVYAGAIMVLFLFVLMLLNIKSEDTEVRGLGLVALSAVGGGLFLYMASQRFLSGMKGFEAALPVEGTAEAIGKLLYTKYVFPFEAASILIIAAITGAVLLAKKRHKEIPLKQREGGQG